jgi:hypothetical protein
MRKGLSLLAAAMLPALAGVEPARGAVIFSTGGSTISQDFDSLSATAWTNDSTLPGWSLFRQPAPGTALTAIAIGDGGSNAGSMYSFGSGGSTERALGGTGSGGAYFGSPASGALAGWIAVSITNDTGAEIDSFTVNYDGEQWRNGGSTSAQTMPLEYGFGATFATVASWISPGASFNFTSPTTGASAAALDGNLAANRIAGLGGTVNGLTWAPSDTLWVRWTETNDTGNDHGLGIDNFSFSATNVPEPAALGSTALAASMLIRRRRR